MCVYIETTDVLVPLTFSFTQLSANSIYLLSIYLLARDTHWHP